MIDLLSELLKPTFEGIGKSLSDKVIFTIKNNLLEYELEEFNRNLYVKTFLHRAVPKNINSIYQPISVKSENGDKEYKIDGISLLKERQFVTLIGSAGSGKSTILKYLIVKCIEEKFAIPIKVELRYLNDYSGTILEYISDKVFRLRGISDESEIISSLLRKGNFVIFFDGYDELDSDQIEIRTKELDEFTSAYGENKFVITSRPYTTISLMPLYHNFSVESLKSLDVKEFIDKQFDDAEKNSIKNKVLSIIESNSNPGLEEFLSNPLLLSMFLLTYQNNSDIPHSRSEFYQQVFDTLYVIHDSLSKLGYEREKRSKYDKNRFRTFLEIFSFLSFFEEKFIFSKEYFHKSTQKIQAKRENLECNFDDLLHDLTVAVCIMNNEGLNLTFPHRSLQEYFCASYISRLQHENKERIYNKILSSFWKNKEHKSGVTNTQFVGKKKVYYIIASSGDDMNLFELLKEMDTRYFIQYCAIPICEKYYKIIDDEILKDTPISESQIFKSFQHIGFFNILSNTKTKARVMNEAAKQLFYENRFRTLYLYGHSNDGESKAKKNKADLEAEKIVEENLVAQRVKMRKTLKQSIERLKNKIDNRIKTDNEFMDLI
jgi:ABC-type oligopeptide transport system ATPase subunit